MAIARMNMGRQITRPAKKPIKAVEEPRRARRPRRPRRAK